MNKYRNTRTGLVVHTTGKVTGDDWECLEELPVQLDRVDEIYDDLDQVEDDSVNMEQEEETAENQQLEAEVAPTKKTRTRKTK